MHVAQTLAAAAPVLAALMLAAFATSGQERLAYYSDYFSFVGEDARGKVAFALDTNRGQDGDAFQAEHFLVLHDERRGWIDVRGNGSYPNPNGVLEAIPDSPDFTFAGAAEKGIVITSRTNGLVLEVAPLPRILERKRPQGLFWLGAAPATLKWEGRTIQGRVIFEYLQRDGWNRLTRKYPGQWRDFHGVYLAVEGGGDFYFHRQDPADEEPLTGTVIGFAVGDGKPAVLAELAIEVPRRAQALGFYRWPEAWRGRFRAGAAHGAFDLELTERKVIANWVIGGFAMGIVKGEVTTGGERRAVYGLGELIL